jgi:hypothetical protein
MTIIITAIATLTIQYIYKEVKYRYKINQQFKETELLNKITRIATEVFETEIKKIIKEDE